MAETLLKDTLSAIADAIRNKKVSTVKYKPSQFSLEIFTIANDFLSYYMLDGGGYGIKAIENIYVDLDAVNIINTGAFKNMTSLKTIDIPATEEKFIASILKEAFYGCSSLEEINLGEGLLTIGENAFSGCKTLAALQLPESLTSIGSNAFATCTSITEITIPKNVKAIGTSPLYECSKLEKISVEEGNEYYYAGDGINVIIRKSGNTLIQGCKNTVIPNYVETIATSAFSRVLVTNVTIPSSVKTLGSSAFSMAFNLSSITFEDGCQITSIPQSCFFNTPLKSINIPDSVTFIEGNAFQICSGLTEISFPPNITSIGGMAFTGCSAMIKYDFTRFTGTTPPIVHANSLDGSTNGCYIVVPDDLYESWISASNWANYAEKIIKQSDYEALQST